MSTNPRNTPDVPIYIRNAPNVSKSYDFYFIKRSIFYTIKYTKIEYRVDYSKIAVYFITTNAFVGDT